MSVRNAGLMAGALSFALAAPAAAQLNIICSVQVEWCAGAVAAFEKQTGGVNCNTAGKNFRLNQEEA